MAELFRHRKDGSIEVTLGDAERALLARIAADLITSLDEPDDSMRRLFPPAYDDAAMQEEYERFTRTDLLAHKRAAAHCMLASLEPVARARKGLTLDQETARAWLGVLNDARLILGTRLEVTEEMDEHAFPPSDPAHEGYQLYLFLGAMEHLLVDALLGALPAVGTE